MSEQQAEKLLATLILARSFSYLMSKFVLGELDTFNLLALRFLLAFAVLLVVLRKHCRRVNRQVLFHGAVIGTTFFLTLSAELTALHSAPSTTVSFLENCSIVLVPLMAAALRRRFPGKGTLGSAALAVFGVALLTQGHSGGMSISAGECTALLAAFFYADTILLTSRFAKDDDPLALGLVQVGTVGVLSLTVSLLTETPHLPTSLGGWGGVVMLALVCTGFGLTLQPMAQSHISAEKAGLFCALSPVSAAVLGGVFLREDLGPVGLLGAALVLCSILLPHFLAMRAVQSKLHRVPRLPLHWNRIFRAPARKAT